MLHSMLIISKTLKCQDSTAYRLLAWQQKHQGSISKVNAAAMYEDSFMDVAK